MQKKNVLVPWHLKIFFQPAETASTARAKNAATMLAAEHYKTSLLPALPVALNIILNMMVLTVSELTCVVVTAKAVCSAI